MSTAVTLDAKQTAALSAARRALNDIIPVLDNARKCGIQCDDLVKAKQEIEDGLAKMEQHFGFRG